MQGIFSSVIIFGTPVWETGSCSADVATTATVSTDSTEGGKSEMHRNPDTWTHYGGSDRTVDGIFKGSKKKS